MRMSLPVLAGCLAATTFLSAPAFAGEDSILQIVVSKETQSLTVYENGRPVATSNVSTGKAGHTTPAGIFSVLEKQKFHRSNLYDDAPMPFMQRLTWSGIALHESGHVPRYPASHGCVRMPRAFAKELYGMTSKGTHVIISEAPVVPEPISHPTLFNLERQVQMLSDVTLRPAVTIDGKAPVEVAMNEPAGKTEAPDFSAAPLPDIAPLRILITWRSKDDDVRAAQTLLTELGYDIGPIDGLIGRQTIDAVNEFKSVHRLGKQPELLSQEVMHELYKAAGRKEPSRGRLIARQNFEEVFSAPVEILNPHKALGTHFLEAVGVNPANGAASWNVVNLPNHLSEKTMERLGLTTAADDAAAPDAAKLMLDRISIPDDIRDKINAMVVPGLSITVTDTGFESNTGAGTDFVTTIRHPPAAKAG